MVQPEYFMMDSNLRSNWRNSLVDRLKNHSFFYGLRRIGQNVKPDTLQNEMGHSADAEFLHKV